MLLFFYVQFEVRLLDWWIVGITDDTICTQFLVPSSVPYHKFWLFRINTPHTSHLNGWLYLLQVSNVLNRTPTSHLLTYYKVLTWFLHVLLLCPRWPQSEHLIGDSSGLRNSLRRRSLLLPGRPGCRFVTAGGLVTPSYFTLSMHAGKMLFLYISCMYSNL